MGNPFAPDLIAPPSPAPRCTLAQSPPPALNPHPKRGKGKMGYTYRLNKDSATDCMNWG